MNMKRNNLFLFLTTLCLTVASAYAAPDFDPKDPPEPGYYRVTLSVNDALMGSVAGAGDYLDGASVTLTATPNSGYQFVQWLEDANTDNPRSITITSSNVSLTAVFEVIPCSFAGNCGASGDNLTWTLSCEGVLTLSGSGAMANYADEAAVPWQAHRDDVTSLVLPAGITTIGNYAFYATNITSVTVPEGVTALGEGAFMECQSLRTIVMPGTLTSIGNLAVAYCGALTKIRCDATTPPALAANAFEGDCYTTVDVPCPALASYKGAAGWSSLDDILPQTSVSVSYTVTPNDALKGSVSITGVTEYCDRTEFTATATPNSGYVFLKWSDDSTENPRDFVLTADLVLTAIFQVEVDAGNLSVCLGYNSFTVLNNPYAADIVLHDKTNAHSTTVTRTATPQVVDIPDEWPEGQYIVEFDEGTHAFIVTKK